MGVGSAMVVNCGRITEFRRIESSMTKQRKDINELNNDELADYIHALDILRARSAQNSDDETGYDFQAGLHNGVFRDDEFIACEHGSDLFLPWHRAHLHYFEQLLQEADPPRTANVTIPYWDWLHPEVNGRFPKAFANPGLFKPGRNVNPTPGSPGEKLPDDTLEIVTEETDWNDFGGFPEGDPTGDFGALELPPHNYMHGFFISGLMGNPSTASEDPIYFSFHAFIDLLWAEWQRRNNAPPPTSPDHDLRGFLDKPKHKVQDFQSTTELGYEYKYTEQLEEAFGIIVVMPTVRRPPLRERRRELIAAAEPLNPQPLPPLFADSLQSELRKTSRADYSFPAPPGPTAAAVVRLQNLKVPTRWSYMLRAYVHPQDVPFAQDDADFERRYFVDYAVLWVSHHEDHDGHHSPEGRAHHPPFCTVRFDVSDSLTGLTPDAISNLVLTLRYIAAPVPAGEPAPVLDLLEEVELDDVLLEPHAS